MNITSFHISKPVSVSNDENGNIFFSFDNKRYYLDIDRHNNLQLIKMLNNSKESKSLKHGKIEQTVRPNTLKSKVIENIITSIDVDDYEDEEIDQVISLQTFPEDAFYDKIDYENSDSEYELDEPDVSHTDRIYFKCYGNDMESPISLETLSIFDTIIIEGDENSNKVVFRSELCNDTASYRVIIYTMGLLKLNIIGTNMKCFMMSETADGELYLAD